MPTFIWPAEDGWPYPDSDDLGGWVEGADDELLSVSASPHLFDELSPLERTVILGRFGLCGQQPRSVKQLLHETGATRADLRGAMGSGLGKLRTRLS
jgi:DNA-directed RNA polymerase sigma subunit (sigma70/sigma32)